MWRAQPPPSRRCTQPGCPLGAVLQRLTIEAITADELQVRVRAVQAGFAADGLRLAAAQSAAAPSAWAALGPRLNAAVLALRR